MNCPKTIKSRWPGPGTQRFLSQPFFVAEQFTGMATVTWSWKDTVRGFREAVDGKHDNLPEMEAFYMVGTIEEAIEKAERTAPKAPPDPEPP